MDTANPSNSRLSLAALPQRMRTPFSRRATGVAAALALEALLVFLILSLGWSISAPEKPTLVEIDFKAQDYSGSDEQTEEPADTAEPSPETPQEAEPVETPPVEQPPIEQPPIRIERPVNRVPLPTPPAPEPTVGPRPIAPAVPGGQTYGPPNTGPTGPSGDSQVVGSAPDGSALYAASWYRPPREDELRGYLSTATGPGWGLIACRTAPDFRVEDCVPLAEYPQGSMINRAVLAATWQFKVRPPRLGGESLVGAWVRIRIDYGVRKVD